jgi:peptide/nickel transport system substrate-binding protein
MSPALDISSIVFARSSRLRRPTPQRLGSLGVIVLLTAMVGCAAPAQAPLRTDGSAPAQGARERTPQRTLSIAFSREPESLEISRQPQNREWAALGSGFLASFDPETQAPVPYLAEELPTVEKGTWKVLPDGRMETTYKIRKNATWHDGQPITAHDWVFAVRARLDPEFVSHSVDAERRLAQAVALDDYTLFLEWREPFLWAGMVHLPEFPPMPRHKLEPLYLNDRAAFMDGPHWREQFLGSGPYRVVSWEPGVDMVFRAHEGFVLGRPAIEEVRVRFIGDANTIVANLLSGGIDFSMSPFIGFSQGQALEQAGFSGKTEYWPGLPRYLEYQGRDWGNTQRAVFDPRVRRASHYAIDRQAIADTIFAGRAIVAYHWVPPIDPTYAGVVRAAPRFEFDPSRAEALLREAGWVKGADGRARNAAGEILNIPIQTLPPEDHQLDAAVVSNNWKAVGITADVQRLSPAEWRDNELRSKFPGVAYNTRGAALADMVWLGRNLSTPENRWGGQNRSGYLNPRLDEAWGKALGSIDTKEREGYLIEAASIMIEDAMVVLTHWTPDVVAYNADLVGPRENAVTYTSRIWNIWEWRWK